MVMLAYTPWSWSPSLISGPPVWIQAWINCLGHTFAVLPVIAAQHLPRLAVAGLLLVWPFIFNAAFIFLRRLRRFAMPYYENVLEFLANGPSVQDIVNYRPSVAAQSRFSELLEANRQRVLTAQEEEELDHCVRIDRMMALLKAKAYRRLGNGMAT